MNAVYRRKRRCESPVPIRGLVESFLKSHGLENEVKKMEVLSEWESIAGAGVAAHAKPVEIKDRILFLWAENPSWRTVLFSQKETLLRKINDAAGKPLVNNLMFTVVPPPTVECT